MKLFRQIALSALLTVGAFCAVLYTSCSKDACKDVTCLHGGTCSGGNCTGCAAGTGGSRCDTVYNTYFANTYVGTGTDNGSPSYTYTNWRFSFSVPSTSSDFTTMNLSVADNTGTGVDFPIVPVTLSSVTSGGANFTIVSTSSVTDVFTGSGTITPTSASITITQTPIGGGVALVYTFSSLAKQ